MTGRVVSPHIAGLATIVGRAAELEQVRLAFPPDSSAPVVLVLCGMGGVGKTSVARAYAQRHLDHYGIVWWIRAEDPAAVDAEFRALLEILLPPGEATRVHDARTVAFAHLAEQDAPWLLILDNVPDPEAAQGLLPPTGHGHVLITSRSTRWPKPTTVRPLDLVAAVELLTTESDDDDKTTAAALAEELDGLPLALTQAAGFARTNGVNLATYLRLYRERSADLHNDGRPADYPHTVATTWQLAIDRLSDKAREMLNILAFYAPDAIPVHLLFKSWDELTRHRAIGELHAHSLITPAGPDTVTIHRLVQAVTRNRLHADLTTHEWGETALRLIAKAIPPEEPATAVDLGQWNILRTHVHVLLGYFPAEHLDSLPIRHRLAGWTGNAGDAAAAQDILADLLLVRERVLGSEHAETLSNMHDLAYWTGLAGDAAGARDRFAELLVIRERVVGSEHPSTLLTRSNVAYWTGTAGHAKRARELTAELLPIAERVMGAEHDHTLTVRQNLASWTGEAGDAEGARDLFAELLPIADRALGTNHPTTLAIRQNVAAWTGELGDTTRARDLTAELFPIADRIMGAEHPLTLSVQFNLARWTGEAGHAVAARDLFAALLPVRERVLGIAHRHTERTRELLAYWSERASGAGEEVGPGGGGEGEGGAGGVLGIADGGD